MPLESKPGTIRVEVHERLHDGVAIALLARIEEFAQLHGLFFYVESPRSGDTLVNITPFDRDKQTIDLMDNAILATLKVAAHNTGRSVQDTLRDLLAAELDNEIARDDLPDA